MSSTTKHHIQDQELWPRGSDHLFTCWAFTTSLHSLWTLPMVIVQQGGLAFLLIYSILVALLGAPLLSSRVVACVVGS